MDIDEVEIAANAKDEELLAMDDALERFTALDPQKAELVKLRYFAGLTNDEAAEILELSPATADRKWAFAKTWLLDRMSSDELSAFS